MQNVISRWDEDRRQRPEEFFRHEMLAKSMAEMTGVNWDDLNNYPGYEKGRWRAMAEEVFARARPL